MALCPITEGNQFLFFLLLLLTSFMAVCKQQCCITATSWCTGVINPCILYEVWCVSIRISGLLSEWLHWVSSLQSTARQTYNSHYFPVETDHLSLIIFPIWRLIQLQTQYQLSYLCSLKFGCSGNSDFLQVSVVYTFKINSSEQEDDEGGAAGVKV